MRVRLSVDARDFLRAEAEYLHRHSAPAARRLVESMQKARKTLGDFPLSGPPDEHGAVPGARRLVVGDYVLIYDLSETGVEIAAIRHGRMRPPTPDVDDDFDYET